MPYKELLVDIRQKHQFFDQFCSAWSSDYTSAGGKLYCGKGCSGCCSLVVNCTAIEALLIARSISSDQQQTLRSRIPVIKSCAERATSLKDWLTFYRQEAGGCPFIEQDGSCGIYLLRPISCRSLHSTREPIWCSTDFSRLSSEQKQEFMAGLDRTAVAFPTHYAATPQEIGQELELAALTKMESMLGCSLVGNLPWLVWLALDHPLEARLAEAPQTAQKQLANLGLLQPYLAVLND